MGIARDVMRATLSKRKLQAKRNRQALEEERQRLAAMKGGRKQQAPPANKALARPPASENKVQAPPPSAPIPLDDIPFASQPARRRAEDAGLTGDIFQGLEPSGKTGFTTADVAKILEARG